MELCNIILNAKWPIFDPKVETACGAATLKWRRNSLSDHIIIIEGISLATAYWAGDSGLYLWKEQEFKIVEEVKNEE